MKPGTKAVLWAVLPFLVLTPLWLGMGSVVANRLALEERVRTQHTLDLDADTVQRSVQQITGKLQSLGQFVTDRVDGGRTVDRGEFSTFAAGLHASSTWIRSFQIVSDGIITHVYPIAGNEAALGYKLLEDPRPIIGNDVLRAQRTGQVTITGPIELIQGGLGIVIRKPLPRSGATERLVALVLNIEPLLVESGISAGREDRVRLSLRRASGEVFFGSAGVFDDQPVVRRIALPDGWWEMGAIPEGGWAASGGLSVTLFYLAGAIIILLVALLVLVLAHGRESLSETVREQTQTLHQELAERRQTEEALRESERHYQTLTEISPVGIFRTDAHGLTTYVNARFCQISGLAPETALGLAWLRAVHPEDRARLQEAWRVATSAEILSAEEFRYVQPDGTVSWVMGQSVPERDETGRVVGYVGTVTDVTERRRVEQTLRQSERKFQSVFDQAAVGVVIVDPGRRYVDCNRRFCEFLDYTTEELNQLSSSDITHPDDVPIDVVETEKISAGVIREYSLEKRFLKKDGTLVWARVFVAPLDPTESRPSFLIGVIEDITEGKRVSEALGSSLKEKEALLKEVHHRVKNNLQVITSLLRLDAGRSADPTTRNVLREMQGRIQAMALLHETLYRSGTFASVDLGAYVRQLASHSFRALSAQPGVIELRVDVAPIRVEMDQAMPCGLIVNELISNCLKHGFPEGRTGEVCVEMKEVPSAPGVRLRVTDTGVGLPPDFDERRSQSLGLQLVSDLSKQLQGVLEVGPGSTFSITFVPRSHHDATESPPRAVN